jgi:hypothetical protein
MLSILLLSSLLIAASDSESEAVSTRLPDWVPPEMGVWGVNDQTMQPDGYKPFLDMAGKHSAYGHITTTLRVSHHELTWPETHRPIKELTEYARRYGIGVAMDLDVRLARKAFMAAHPDELQGMLRLREIELGDTGEASLQIKSSVLTDHYTNLSAEKYVPVTGKLVRVYSYVKGPNGIRQGTLQDITSSCRVATESKDEVAVSIPLSEATRGRTACVMALFDLLTPDVFAPHLLDYHRMIYKRYADIGLSGACKDEWGFPPDSTGCPAHNDFWFSRFYADAYAKEMGGRDLVADCLLMCLGEEGRQAERCHAINAYHEMSCRRNGEVEDAHYRMTKAFFGKDAIVATHPTWWPNPDPREFKKNGLDWWISTRDIAQVDEVTPYCARTALAKKWPCPLWYNMYYSKNYEDYVSELWSAALAGGRINYHPIYPCEGTPAWRMHGLLTGDLMRANSRVRLLNFITKAPVDSPVAVVFGHACAMNWAGPGCDDVGLKLTDTLWKAGYYADLIPTSEIENGSLRVQSDGFVHYGKQRYAAMVLYHPEFEKPSTAEFLKKAAILHHPEPVLHHPEPVPHHPEPVEGGTALYRIGDWTRGFEGKPYDARLGGSLSLPMADIETCAGAVVDHLKKARIEPNTPATRTIGWDRASLAPPRAGVSRMIDGMRVIVEAERSVAGDPIQKTITVDGHQVTIDAVGIVGIRLTRDGKLDALAAGGLKHLEVGDLALDLAQRVDVAIWRDESGKFKGVLQDYEGDVPPALAAITKDWLRLAVPEPAPLQAEAP